LKKPQVLNGGCLKTSNTYQGFLKPQVYHFLLEVVIPPTKKPQVKLCFFVVNECKLILIFLIILLAFFPFSAYVGLMII